ncbi:MAG: hypothetical protein IPM48_03125 [Saprospiraceae bacterium]|nr:hypothetical protein [Saprospiraceae bacterium]
METKALVSCIGRTNTCSLVSISCVLFLLTTSCKTNNKPSATAEKSIDNQQLTQVNPGIPDGQNVASFAQQSLQSRKDMSEFNRMLNDPALNFFLQSHPQFDFVFFAFPDQTLDEISRQTLDSVRASGYNDTKFEFFASHVSMVSKGLPFLEGVNFIEKPLKIDNNTVIYNNKSVKIIEKIPSHERIQVFLIQNPLQS